MPAGRSKQYTDIDERCRACEVLGGEEPPCVPADLIPKYQTEKGRDCPRVDVWPVNVDAARLALLLLGERGRAAFDKAFTLWEVRTTPTVEAAEEFLFFVTSIVQSTEVSEAIHPPKKPVAGKGAQRPQPPARPRPQRPVFGPR